MDIFILLLIISIYFSFELYYKSSNFLEIKNSINEYIKNCNELNEHIEELKSSYNNQFKKTNNGVADYSNTSKYKYKKKFLAKNASLPETVDCSLTVCRGAQREPFKYFCKYFNVPENEDSLNYFEKTLNDFEAAEQGKHLLKKEEEKILSSVSDKIPFIVRTIDKKRLLKRLGFYPIDLSQLYFPKYIFKYISSGGNSSNSVTLTFDINNLNNFVEYLSQKIKFRKSIAGQRALMTTSLRNKIKERDNHTCKICGISTNDEPNLLLEIDHIIPLSKGGITSEDNLQTLCWKCNRSKGSKLI